MSKVPRGFTAALSGKGLTTPSLTRRAARSMFYAALDEVAPYVGQDLERTCAPQDPLPDTEIYSCVQRWAARYGIAHPWLIEDAIAAVGAMPALGRLRLKPLRRADEDVAISLATLEGAAVQRPLSAARFIVRMDETFVWSPFKTPRDEWKSDVLAELERVLDARLDHIDRVARTAGAKDADKKQEIARHMVWLVQRVVGKRAPEDIAVSVRRTTRAVEAALKGMSELTGLHITRRRSGPRRGARKASRPRTVQVAAPLRSSDVVCESIKTSG